MRKRYGKARGKHNRPAHIPHRLTVGGVVFEVVDYRQHETAARNLARKVGGKWTVYGSGYIVLKRPGGAV